MGRENDYFNHTSIHTRVNAEYRISSIWREYGNGYFNDWAWETFVWKRLSESEKTDENDCLNETIDYQPDTELSAERVLKVHRELYHKITNGLPYEESEDNP